jgi:hypothetical protein
VISLNLVLAGLRLGLKNRQVDEKWVLILYAVVNVTNILSNTELALGLICLARILFVAYDLTKTWRGVQKN